MLSDLFCSMFFQSCRTLGEILNLLCSLPLLVVTGVHDKQRLRIGRLESEGLVDDTASESIFAFILEKWDSYFLCENSTVKVPDSLA